MKPYKIVSSLLLGDTEALYPSDSIYSGVLVTNVEQTVSVPTDTSFVIFGYEDDIYVNYDTTASVPTSTISQAGGELNPKIRYVGETSVIHLISQFTTKVVLTFYSKNEI